MSWLVGCSSHDDHHLTHLCQYNTIQRHPNLHCGADNDDDDIGSGHLNPLKNKKYRMFTIVFVVVVRVAGHPVMTFLSFCWPKAKHQK